MTDALLTLARSRDLGIALALAFVGLAAASGCNPDAGVGSGHRDAGPFADARGSVGPDADRDGISDVFEGRNERVDTDGDGTLDYRDDDSDDDSISDLLEGGVNASGVPRDSDGDGTPDFRDLDADGNGIPDSDEGGGDVDMDGVADADDTDDDGDGILDATEIGGNPDFPTDSDGDGTPDFRDVDSDNDTIADSEEGAADTDGDGQIDRFDPDSDNDGVTDATEAGDDRVDTTAADTDLDGTPDFRDPDSDDDGVSDRDEDARMTSRTNPDTDGDGVSDLVEIVACPLFEPSCANDVTDATASPRTRGDFVFLEPYERAPDPTRDTLKFATDLRVADVYFLMDTTGSMSGPISSLQSGLSTPTTGLIDRIRAVIPDVWFGVGDHKDYPVSPYGDPGDFAFLNRQSMSMDPTVSQRAVNAMRASGGNDTPESQIPALWAIATGMGLPGRSGSTSAASCPDGTVGYPCFRMGAVPIVVLITDVPVHNGPGGSNGYSDSTLGGHAPTYTETVTALTAANIRVIGINVGGGATNLAQLARDTHATDAGGSPLVSTYSSGAISDVVLRQIQTLANQTPLDISIRFNDDASDAVDTFPAFVDHIEANTAGDVLRGCDPHDGRDTDGDGILDMFPGVTPGSPVCFDIVVKMNTTIMPTSAPQLFKATLEVVGDGFTVLDHRDIFFLVPPTVVIDGPD